MDDANENLKAFLDYVAGRKSDNDFVKKLEGAVKEAKMNREWRHEFMSAPVRLLRYNRWESGMVRFSQPPLSSLGVKVAT